ncbi:MAG: phosphotransferase [Proteobacteria bacterium]|nr:phosphotransferase [Pseudomonadota bacterium]MBU1584136.1 phosphotransferase [Pseudomonadota bacterium]MBU2452303.1 phosphotransferase [Pseudomonadota bacterium]MBU2630153.1 phosphotransferase [Pseudomonadota bacterium]
MQEFYDKDCQEFIFWLNRQWNIEFECVRQDIEIQGSPERTLSRVVIQDKDGLLFLVEKFAKTKFLIRQDVAKAIEYLNQNGLKQALMYQKTKNGRFLPFYRDGCFQLSSFLDSTGIKRPDYLSSSKMGLNFAIFLIDLSFASANIEKKIFFKPFSIKKYIYKLFREMKIYDNKMYKRFLPYLSFLEKEFMEIHDKLPISFCHGDLHPLNVIWDQDQISAVIDWEFTGMKPDIYDAANIVGCAGIENPNGLGMPMVKAFLKQTRRHNLFKELGWRFFPEYVLALRFAWLSEWLRKKDKLMLEMEEAYMGILVNNMDILRQEWER